jgi:anti-anti-sigma regulatory factor
MLRISVLNEAGITRVKLEGKLAHEWVAEARKAWAAMSETSCKTGIVVDLMNVSFVDDAGSQLLAEMRHAGAELMGSGPLISALIDEIEQAETAIAEEPSNWD